MVHEWPALAATPFPSWGKKWQASQHALVCCAIRPPCLMNFCVSICSLPNEGSPVRLGLLCDLRSGFSSRHVSRRYLGSPPRRSCRKGFIRFRPWGISCKRGDLWPCHGKRLASACAMSQPMISALSSIEPSRPERPPWPASISVLNKRSCASVLLARSRATHLAGSA